MSRLSSALSAGWSRLSSRRERDWAEDALKHILAWKHRSQLASLESLAGALTARPAAVLRVVKRMEREGWIEARGAGIELTARGERRALEVVRAHRLWERHLSDDANMPIERLHRAAERAEHILSKDEVSELDAHLGHPQHDPHGDPIPSPDGRLARLDAASLGEWPVGRPARIAHIEDEPEAVFREILAAGLRPALVVRVLESSADGLVVAAEGRIARIDRAVAASIQVSSVREQDLLPAEAIRLSHLSWGEAADVLELGPSCQGLSRRRLQDLGLTPGARVRVALENSFGDPRAYRVRGTTIAMRREQADQVWIRRRADARPGEAAP